MQVKETKAQEDRWMPGKSRKLSVDGKLYNKLCWPKNEETLTIDCFSETITLFHCKYTPLDWYYKYINSIWQIIKELAANNTLYESLKH
jgi:hypothetical protein